jgi:hypothetical protein
MMQDSPFIRFWEALNAAMRDRDMPELGFGAARTYWLIAQGK